MSKSDDLNIKEGNLSENQITYLARKSLVTFVCFDS